MINTIRQKYDTRKNIDKYLPDFYVFSLLLRKPFIHMSIAYKISAYNRARKYRHFKENVEFASSSRVLDVGFANSENSPIDNSLERNYPYRHNITALGMDGKDLFEKEYPEIKVVLYDGKIFPFENDYFDIGWSNAVIEHVGNREKQVFFLREFLRTCTTVYFTTPNRYFPFEIHTRIPFLHWLPKHIFDKILSAVGQKWATGDYMYLLSKKEIKSICQAAGAKQITIKGNRFFGFVMDYSVILER